MSLKFVFMFVIMTCANNISTIVGINNISMLFTISLGIFSGTICINAINKHDMYPSHLTGFDSFSTALKYSCILRNAIVDKNISTIYLFPSVNIITTNGKPSTADVTLFISILAIYMLVFY